MKAEVRALYFAARDPGTPWYAKLLVAAIVAYALSPIDLIPDFVPVLGYLDDLIVLPLGIAWAIRLIPPAVMADCRARVDAGSGDVPGSPWATAVIVLIWVALAISLALWAYQTWRS
ncbi:YkvA family protein [Lysobacter sp. FW306-1B-D06B]|uniref:YkvA family protein n=1 Tax=Lysobacter sp. FW306-1B-D06B TaxID=3140250 RepID=UPI0031407DF1